MKRTEKPRSPVSMHFADRAWQDRLEDRLNDCRRVVRRLEDEGTLRAGLDPERAADPLWTLTSLRMWEDLVLQRRWSPERYEERLSEPLLASLTDYRSFPSGR